MLIYVVESGHQFLFFGISFGVAEIFILLNSTATKLFFNKYIF